MKLKSLFLIAIAAVCGVCLSGCLAVKGKSGAAIPYQVAERYFVRNDVAGLPPTTVTSAKEFEQYFGMAAVMGPNGAPTKIDFDKSYVICISAAPTDVDTEFSVESLTKTASDELLLRYRVKCGEKMTSTMQPLLLLIVDKKYDLPVVLKAVGD